MGIDGYTFIGDAVVIISSGLSDIVKTKIDKLFSNSEFENNVVIFNGMNSASDSYIVVWAQEPQSILTDNRRPLILTNKDQYTMLGAQQTFEDQVGLDLDDEKLWDPSYKDQLWMFTQEDPMGGPILEMAIKRLQEQTKKKQKFLVDLLRDDMHTLVGNFLVYFAM